MVGGGAVGGASIAVFFDFLHHKVNVLSAIRSLIFFVLSGHN